jgi:cytochrome P450
MIKAGASFYISFEAIHHDPAQWPEPEKFEPERFNTKNKDNKWLLTANGKPRNPLAFTPFMGGRRVCLGKTFAETTIRFTFPLIFQHLDFEFVNPEAQMAEKQPYGVGGMQEIKIPMLLKIKNPVK